MSTTSLDCPYLEVRWVALRVRLLQSSKIHGNLLLMVALMSKMIRKRHLDWGCFGDFISAVERKVQDPAKVPSSPSRSAT